MKMPEQIFSGRSRSSSIDTVYSEMKKRATEDQRFYAPGRQVCGFTLASFQRDLKWDVNQSVKFIESAWLGLHLGEWVVNAQEWEGVDGTAHPLSGILIDGQQRFHALELYWKDSFPVFGHKWSDLDIVEQRRFLRRPFGSTEVAIFDEDVLKELSDRLNYGGTPHLESERAVAPGMPSKIRRGP